MSNYQHILFAADFSEHCDFVAQKARHLATQNSAKLSIIHIVDNLPITDAAYGPVIPFELDLTEELMKAAEKRLATLSEKINITKEQQYIEMGSTASEIVATAKENNVDLIIVGSHGRHGLALLLGSTANAVLHHATCDVLAVRLKED